MLPPSYQPSCLDRAADSGLCWENRVLMRKTIPSSTFKPKCRYWGYLFDYHWLLMSTLHKVSIARCFPQSPKDCWTAFNPNCSACIAGG